jgi:hypothetical protein
MAIHFACPYCIENISVDESKARTRIECPHCNRPVKVPAQSTHEPPPSLPESSLASSTDTPASGCDAMVRTARTCSRWFYWIAGLSLVNTLLYYGGAPIRIAFGLGFTQLVDVIVGGIFPQLQYLSFAVDVVIAAAFVGFGYLSGHGETSAFVVGLILYVADGLLYLGLMILGRTPSGIVAIIWRGVAIYFLWKGLQAARELKTAPPELPATSQAGS